MGAKEYTTWKCDRQDCEEEWTSADEGRWNLPAAWAYLKLWTDDAEVLYCLCPVHVYDAQGALRPAGIDLELVKRKDNWDHPIAMGTL